jgi:hypothetical protein
LSAKALDVFPLIYTTPEVAIAFVSVPKNAVVDVEFLETMRFVVDAALNVAFVEKSV